MFGDKLEEAQPETARFDFGRRRLRSARLSKVGLAVGLLTIGGNCTCFSARWLRFESLPLRHRSVLIAVPAVTSETSVVTQSIKRATTLAAPCRKTGAGRQWPLLHLDSATAAGGQLPEPKPRSGREGVANARQELDLFGDDTLPQGFQYRPEFIDPDQEKALLADIRVLPFRDFEFHGF